MRWVIAGFLFALAVTLAVGTAAIRADNTRMRRHIERSYREVQDRVVELRRLDMLSLDAASPRQLAAAHWRWLHREAQSRSEGLQ
jgi:hypothetical protein